MKKSNSKIKYITNKISGKISLMDIYVMIIFLFYPLFYNNFYFDIVTCKFKFFVILTGITLILYVMSYFYSKTRSKSRTHSSKVHIDRLFYTNPDFYMVILYIVNLISLIISSDFTTSLYGTRGRNAGFITITCYICIYFMIKKRFTLKGYHLAIVSLSGGIVSVIGILQFINIDFLGFYKGLTIDQQTFYISTIGHSNVYTSLFSITLITSLIMYVVSEKRRNIIFFGICGIVNFMGVIAGQCDSGYIIILITFILSLIMCKESNQIKRVLWLFCIMLLSGRMLVFYRISFCKNYTIENFTGIFMKNGVFIPIWLILLISIFIFNKINKDYINNRVNIIKKGIIGFFFAGIASYLLMLLYFSTYGKQIDLGMFSNYLRMTDSYGSYRGYVWRVTIEEFGKLPIINKLLGIGCDALRPFFVNTLGEKMYSVTNTYYDNAHNEYLQYLITTGIIGLSSYMGLIICKIRNVMRKSSIYSKVAICVVICYMLQGLININQVITTPLFLIFLFSIKKKEI